MKILHVINNLGSGGAEKLLEQILPTLNNVQNIKIELLLLTDEDNIYGERMIQRGLKVSVIPHGNLKTPLNIFSIRKFIQKGNFDIVHTHLFPAQYWTALAVKLIKNGPRLVTTEHSTFNRRRQNRYFRLIDSFIYSIYDKVFSISEKTQENLMHWIFSEDNSHNKFEIVENGIDLTEFENAKAYSKCEINNNFNEEDLLIAMVGRFSYAKDQKTIIRALKFLPSYVHLLLIGEGPLKDECVSLAAELNLENNVHFLGYRNDVSRILKSIDLMVLSSKWEGFGLAAVESMASGTLVLGTNVEGLSEVIGDSDLLFEVGNAIELSEKINFFITEKEITLRKRNNLLKAAKEFSIENVIEKYVLQYKKLT